MTPRPAGDSGLLLELDREVRFPELHAAAAAASQVAGVVACITGHSSVYLLFDGQEPFQDRAARVTASLAQAPLPEDQSDARVGGRTHRVQVDVRRESAPDLDRLLRTANLSYERFREVLGSLHLRVRFLGFRAGFGYLEGLPAEWSLPRLSVPRAFVAAGSLGIAAGMAAFYPTDSPGGWNLIGRAAERFWDPHHDPPNLISAGDEIFIEPVESSLAAPTLPARVRFEGEALAEVLRPGQLTMVVGPAEWRRYRYGLPIGGPFDADAAAAANAAVGNRPDAALLECTLVGPQLLFAGDCHLSLYGAQADVMVNEVAVRDPRQFQVRSGGVVTVGRLRKGMRAWLALRGPIENPAPKYAVSPEMLRAGMELFAGRGKTEPARLVNLDRHDSHVVRAAGGPHAADRNPITDQLWEVTPSLDRTGIRLRPLSRLVEQPADLPSCGTQFGTVQWHPNGELVALGPDHPITGGYLQPMTVLESERWKLAQLAPGDRVRWMIQA